MRLRAIGGRAGSVSATARGLVRLGEARVAVDRAQIAETECAEARRYGPGERASRRAQARWVVQMMKVEEGGLT